MNDDKKQVTFNDLVNSNIFIELGNKDKNGLMNDLTVSESTYFDKNNIGKDRPVNIPIIDNQEVYNNNFLERDIVTSNELINIPLGNNNTIDGDTDKNKERFSVKDMFISMFSERKFFQWLFILIFLFVTITVGKTFYLRSMVNKYGFIPEEVKEKDSMEIIMNVENNYNEDNFKDIAASELVKCINSSVKTEDLPSSVTSVINEIKNYYNQSGAYFSFKYKDIYTGFSVSYNENQHIYAASTIKAPTDIYVYEMASLGKINLNDKIKYENQHYVYGSGIIKNSKINTLYDVKTLLRYSTVISDNVAHNMLMDTYGRLNMLKFWEERGTTAIFKANNNWGGVNAHDAVIYMEELYKFYSENEVYGKEIMSNFMNADPKFIKGKNGYKVANKSGWGANSIHDVSIIFADNPYILVALSNLGQTDYYMSYFNKVNDLAYKLHTEYWKYKMDVCSDIEQY